MSPPEAPILRLDLSLLARLVEELQEELVGLRVVGVSTPLDYPEDLLLFFARMTPAGCDPARPGPLLRAVVTPGRARLHLESQSAANPNPPPGVRGLSRSLLERPLLELALLPGERIVLLKLGPGSEPGAKRSLLLELFPPGAWLLLDEEDRIQLASRAGAGGRSFAPGATWLAPRPHRPAPEQPSSWPEGAKGPGASLNEAVASFFRRQDAALLAEAEARRHKALLAKAEARALGRVAALQAQAAEGLGAGALRRQGELLKANLQRTVPGQAFIEVEDFFEPELPLVRIALDPARSPRTVMQALFHRARRLERGQAQVAQRLAEAGRLASLAQEARAALEAGQPWEELLERLGPLRKNRLLVLPGPPPVSGTDRAAARAAPGERFRRFTSREGVPILVGRDRRQNDVLTTRVARGNDLWLHAGAGLGGSHVVVRLARGKPVSPETLLDAAHLALHYSQARGRPRAEVIWTERKWVRKPKGLPPGQVRVDRSRTLLVDLDTELLARLLASAGEEQP